MLDASALPVRIGRRRAIEALRAGVPSRDAVAVLGSGQPEIEDRFEALLEAGSDAAPGGRHPGGLLLGGGFGSGKSHLLTHLGQLALDSGYVVSRVVISKETPLHDPNKVFRAAAEAARLPTGHGNAIEDAAASLDPDSPSYVELLRWASTPRAELNERFIATLMLYAAIRRGTLRRDEEFAQALARFWAGDPIKVADLRRGLKEIGEDGTLSAVSAKELSRQRLRFVARLFAAAGFAGWLVLFDEVELIGRYSLLARARSYGELATWLRGEHGDPGLPLVAVLAMTDDFEAAVLSAKNDREVVPTKLRARQTPEHDRLAAAAEAGMRLIEQSMLRLSPPDSAELDRAYQQLKLLHGEAFGWSPPDVPGLERLGATQMRQYVRAWINEWDLLRLDPTYAPRTEARPLTTNYAEDGDLGGDEPTERAEPD